MIKCELSTSCRYISKWVVQFLGSAKNWPNHKPCCAPMQRIPFINVVQPFYECQINARKIITVTVLVRVSVMDRVSLLWFVSGNNLLRYVSPSGDWNVSHCRKFEGIADSRKYAPEIRGHSKYTKIRPRKNFWGIANSRKYTPEIRGHSISLKTTNNLPLSMKTSTIKVL